MSTFLYSVDIKKLEKAFGPYFEGANEAEPGKTVSAVEQITRGSRRGQYLGMLGVHPDAAFYVQFPEVVDLSGYSVTRQGRKMPVDSVTGLSREGPQGNQRRLREVDDWREAQRLAQLSGEHQARLVLDEIGIELPVRVMVSGKPPKQQVKLKSKTKVWLRDAKLKN